MSNNLKELISLTSDDVTETKSAYDIIEDKVLGDLKKTLAKDVFEKEKKEL